MTVKEGATNIPQQAFNKWNDTDGNPLAAVNRDGSVFCQSIKFPDGTSQSTSAGNQIVLNPVVGVTLDAAIRNAIAALPSTGGIINAQNLTGPQSFTSNLTINKNSVTILFGTCDVSMGAFTIIVPSGTIGVKLVGANAWGSSGSAALNGGTYFLYSGTSFAFAIGDNAGSFTRYFFMQDIAVFCSATGAAGGVKFTNCLTYGMERCRLAGQNAANTGMGVLSYGDSTNAAVYSSLGYLTDNEISGFFIAAQIDGSASSTNGLNKFFGNKLNGPGQSVTGSTCILITANGSNSNDIQDFLSAADIGLHIQSSFNIMPNLRVEQSALNTHIQFDGSGCSNNFIVTDATVPKVTFINSASTTSNTVFILGTGFLGQIASGVGQATITAGNTTASISFTTNYTSTNQPVIVITPTSGSTGLPWITYSGSTGAWTGFTINIPSTLGGNATFNYICLAPAS